MQAHDEGAKIDGTRAEVKGVTGGTGLGLAIAHQLSLALEGSLTLVNRPGGGLAATLTFPVG